MKNVYVASSWRNNAQPQVVAAIRLARHEVYDFKNPRPGNHGFHWSEIDPKWQGWSATAFRSALDHPVARNGFLCDYNAMLRADTCVLVLPCGRSAHTEAGWFSGMGKRLIILLDGSEPELMYKIAFRLCCSIPEVLDAINAP